MHPHAGQEGTEGTGATGYLDLTGSQQVRPITEEYELHEAG